MATCDAVCRWEFQGLSGFFFDFAEQQAMQKPLVPAITLPSIGLVDRLYGTEYVERPDSHLNTDEKPWQRLENYIASLNSQDTSTVHKVLYITRHGYSFHNAFMAQVGGSAWKNYWSHLDGNDEITWADSHLNEKGIEQVKALGLFWSAAVQVDMVPLPGSIYTSPLARTLETTRLAFADVMKDNGAPFRPIVKELLRERLTNHTCDRRSSLSWIKQHYPNYIIEPGFSEEDELWSSSREETAEEHKLRKQRLLADIFEKDQSTFIELTTHSYAISAILEAVNLQVFRVSEGTSIALLVKGKRVLN